MNAFFSQSKAVAAKQDGRYRAKMLPSLLESEEKRGGEAAQPTVRSAHMFCCITTHVRQNRKQDEVLRLSKQNNLAVSTTARDHDPMTCSMTCSSPRVSSFEC